MQAQLAEAHLSGMGDLKNADQNKATEVIEDLMKKLKDLTEEISAEASTIVESNIPLS